MFCLFEALLFLNPGALSTNGQNLRSAVIQKFAFHPLRDLALDTWKRDLEHSYQLEQAAVKAAFRRLAPERTTGSNSWRAHQCLVSRRSDDAAACRWMVDFLKDQNLYRPIPKRPWTVITATFLHAGLLHLLINASVLLTFGGLALQRMGPLRFLAFFLAAGIAGFVAHWGLRGLLRGSETAVIGASGAIMGCLGYHWAVLFHRSRRMRPDIRAISPSQLLLRQILTFLWVDLLLIVLATFISGEAHIGGLVFGFLFGGIFVRHPRKYRASLS